MSRVKGALTRKLGPFPAYVWLAIAGGAILLYRRWSGGLGLLGTSTGNTSQSNAGTVAVGQPAGSTASGGGGDAPPAADTTNAGDLSNANLGSPGAPVVFDPQTGTYTPADSGVSPTDQLIGLGGNPVPYAGLIPLPTSYEHGVADFQNPYTIARAFSSGPKSLSGAKPTRPRTHKGTGSSPGKTAHPASTKKGLSRPITTTAKTPTAAASRSGAHAPVAKRVNLTKVASPRVRGIVQAPTAPAVRAGATRTRVAAPAKSVVTQPAAKTAPATPAPHPTAPAVIHPPPPPPKKAPPPPARGGRPRLD